MSKKYRQPVLERKTREQNPYVKTNYRDTAYRRPQPKPLVPIAPVITPSQWFKSLIIMLLPLINLIAACVWAFNKKIKINETKRNWAKATVGVLVIAYLIIAAILVIYFLVVKK
ncbi:MAG TPA: MscL family protein [Clostridiales bacterium]|nr:MscL family protein [Clostridiales bacterium]